jgi:hypothetical protein
VWCEHLSKIEQLCGTDVEADDNINELHGSRTKIPGKKSYQAALRGGI